MADREEQSQSSSRQGSRRKSLCRHWLRGYCRLGDGCHFEHGGEPAPIPKGYAANYARQVQLQASSGTVPSDANAAHLRDMNLYGGNVPAGGISQPFDLQSLRHSLPPYTLGGPGGSMQTFSLPQLVHYPNRSPGIMPPLSRNQLPSPSPFPANHRRQTAPCRHWVRGFCRLGETCNFAHFGQPPLKSATQGGGLRCRHWAKGFCQLGTACRFVHSGTPGHPLPDNFNGGSGFSNNGEGGSEAPNRRQESTDDELNRMAGNSSPAAAPQGRPLQQHLATAGNVSSSPTSLLSP
eukprot:g52692.t1